jgi:glutamate dehydrogenase/leucine dehydrogenase
MALETLLHSQQEAARLMGIDYREVEALQQPKIVMEGVVEVGGREVNIYRAHSGAHTNEAGITTIGKGGIRMAEYPTIEEAVSTVKELSVEMLGKLGLRNHTGRYHGAKGLFVVDAAAIDHAAKSHAARHFQHRMDAAGLSRYDRDVPAGDVGTNGLSDAYALEHRKRNPRDPYWQGVITGKTPEIGGLAFRPEATAWGAFVTQKTTMNAYGHDRAETTIQGFGNVGSYHAHFASTDPEQRTPVMAISDRDGTLATDDPRGIEITREMVQTIGDNPHFQGSKIHALAEEVAKNQPGLKIDVIEKPNAVLYAPADYFVPAAMGNVVGEHNVDQLGARLAIIQDANGPVKPKAHRRLVEKGIINMPDIVANGAGVDCSIKEHQANIEGHVLATEQVQKELTMTSEQVVRDVLTAAERLGTRDLGIAAAGVSIARIMRKPGLLRELVAAA